MNDVKKNWTGNIQLGVEVDHAVVLKQLCKSFNACPFFKYSGMEMRVVDDQIEAYVEMKPELVGNLAFQILHGGVAATILDSIGGIVAMEQLYRHSTSENLPDTIKKVSRLAIFAMPRFLTIPNCAASLWSWSARIGKFSPSFSENF